MADKDELIIKIGADFAELKRELGKAEKVTEDFSKSGQKNTKALAASFAAMKGPIVAATAALTAFGVATGAVIKMQIDAARQTKLWSARLDIQADKFSQLVAVGKKFGVEMEDVGDAMKDLNERISDAALSGGEMGEVITELRLNAKHLISLPMEEQFLKVADAIGKMKNAGDRNRATAVLMADAGFRMIPVFQKGEKAIRGMMKASVELGDSFTAADLKQFDDMDKVFRELDSTLDSLGKEIFRTTAPMIIALTEVADGAAKAMKAFNDAITSTTGIKENSALVEEAATIRKKLIELGGSKAEFWGVDPKKQVEIDTYKMRLEEIDAILNKGDTEEPKKVSRMSTVTVGSGPAEEEKKFIPEKESGAEFGPMPQVDLLTERIAEFADIKNQSRLAELTAQADFNAQMFAQEKSVQDNNKKLWQSGAKGKMQIASKMMGSLSSLMNSENRKMFEVGKAAATGQAVIDTYKAATGAYSAMSSIPYVGPALGAAAAAAAVASGMAQVQKIQSTQFGGGGGASAAGVTGAGVAGTPQPQEVIQTTQFDVSLQGESFSGEQIRGLVGQINDATDDNIKLNAVSA